MKKIAFTLLLSAVAVYLTACGGTSASTSNTQTTPAPAPTISVTPNVLTLGQSTQLTWNAGTGTSASVSGPGLTTSTALTGNASVTPPATGTVTYTISATNSGGTTSQTATVTVNSATTIAPPAPTITATPGIITSGQSTVIAWNAGATATSASFSGPGLTTSTALTGSVSVSPTSNATYTITATNTGGSNTQSVTVTVNAPPPTASLVCTPNSVTLGNSVNCAITSVNATTVIASSTDGSWTGQVTTNGNVSVTPTSTTGSVTYSITATGSGGSVTASSNPITVTSTAIQLTAITPAVKWIVGQGGFQPFTFFGANFANGEPIVTNPDANVQYAQSQLINSGQWNVYFGIDQIHEGAGWRNTTVCKSAGSGCSPSMVFGFYGPQVCDIYSATGEKFCLSPGEVVAGQHVVGGVAQNGYVDKFNASGAPDGKFFVGAPTTSLAVEPNTGFVSVDGGISDQNGGITGIVFPQGFQQVPVVAVKAKAKLICFLQPSVSLNLSCYYVGGAAGSQTQVISTTVGTNPQSLDLAVINGNPYVVVVDAGSSPAIYSVQVTSTALTVVNSQPLVGVTAGIPGGSQINTFDSLGVGVVTAFGDKLAIPFSESTLRASSGIALPGIPVNAVASTANGVVIIGNADQPNAGGNFTEVNPVTGAATAVPSAEASTMPVWVEPAVTGRGFSVCPQDGVSSCSIFNLP